MLPRSLTGADEPLGRNLVKRESRTGRGRKLVSTFRAGETAGRAGLPQARRSKIMAEAELLHKSSDSASFYQPGDRDGRRPRISWRPIPLRQVGRPRRSDRTPFPEKNGISSRTKCGESCCKRRGLSRSGWSWPTAARTCSSTGLLGCGLSWSWAHDAYTAGIVTDRLLTRDRAIQRSPLPASARCRPPRQLDGPDRGGTLAQWAVYLARFAGEDEPIAGEP